MARLNDAAAPIDPVELLRRKYSRQNKEIARINSTQCIRIRNLENEVSRLLGENLSLQEQILRLQSDAASNRAQQVVDHVSAIKSSLEAKLSEIGALVTTLGVEPPTAAKRSTREKKSAQPSPTQSPDQRNWKNVCTLSEAAGLQEGRLPPILEDKHYPRRTLEPTEIQDILSHPISDNTDSPDIGPPPVSKFIDEDPVKIDLPSRIETDGEDGSGLDPSRSANLEQRKKRRDSTAPIEHKKSGRFEPGCGHSSKEVTQSLKAGAKRKLSIRDDDEGATITKTAETSPDDFKYTRRMAEGQTSNKTLGASEKASNKTQREFAIARGVPREKEGSSSTTRRVLGPKTANTGVTSPKKNSKAPLVDELLPEKPGKPRGDQAKERLRESKTGSMRVKPAPEHLAAMVTVEPEPETPAPPDLFSPPASGSSAARPESRDTPPPPDLGPGNEGQRPSRRARGSVSYAEPSLRDKMRRPTKEFVDAVTGEGKAQRLSNTKLETDAPTTAKKIKEEPSQDDAWRDMPISSTTNEYAQSPLSDKVSSRDFGPEAMITQRQRRRLSTHHGDDGEPPRSGTSSAISALISGHRKVKQEAREEVEGKVSLDRAMAKLDIYEFTGSSPREPSDSKIPSTNTDWRGSRASRRLSSIVQDPAPSTQAEGSDGEHNQKGGGGSSRRRQSIMVTGVSASTADSDSHRLADDLKRSTSQSAMNGGAERRERTNARRRSMML